MWTLVTENGHPNYKNHQLKVVYPAVYVESERYGDILDLWSLIVHRTNYFPRDFNRTLFAYDSCAISSQLS